MESNQNKQKIYEKVPHRFPFLFIDKVLSLDIKNQKVTCLKNFTISEFFFSGHFPGNPVVPGVIIIEAIAQASIILFAELKPEIAKTHPDYFLGKVEAKFKNPVFPGDLLFIEIQAVKILTNRGIVEAVARVKEREVAEANIAFGVKLK